MKKAVIKSGGKQYLVAEGDEIEVELLGSDKKSAEFPVLLKFDGDQVDIGKPEVDGAKVVAVVVEAEVKADKVIAIRYKAKKRVKKIRGHRQRLSRVKIKSIA